MAGGRLMTVGVLRGKLPGGLWNRCWASGLKLLFSARVSTAKFSPPTRLVPPEEFAMRSTNTFGCLISLLLCVFVHAEDSGVQMTSHVAAPIARGGVVRFTPTT